MGYPNAQTINQGTIFFFGPLLAIILTQLGIILARTTPRNKETGMNELSELTSFKIGDYVKIAVHTDAFMQGFTYGSVIGIGRKWITVAWYMNPSVKRRFTPGLLCLMGVRE